MFGQTYGNGQDVYSVYMMHRYVNDKIALQGKICQ